MLNQWKKLFEPIFKLQRFMFIALQISFKIAFLETISE